MSIHVSGHDRLVCSCGRVLEKSWLAAEEPPTVLENGCTAYGFTCLTVLDIPPATETEEGRPRRRVRQVPSIGRMVHYVVAEGRSKGQHRMAFVVNVPTDVQPDSTVNLQVQLDGPYDTQAGGDDQPWIPRVPFDPSGQLLGSWHWPEYVPPVEED